MHQSPQKLLGGTPRPKYSFLAEDGEIDGRALRALPPKARRHERRSNSPREERGGRHPPRG